MKKPEQIMDAIIKQSCPIKIVKVKAPIGKIVPTVAASLPTEAKKTDVIKDVTGQPMQSKPFFPVPKPVEVPLTPHEALGHKPGKLAEAQLLEVSPGVYDIIFTCSCGARSVIRCHSLDASKAE